MHPKVWLYQIPYHQTLSNINWLLVFQCNWKFPQRRLGHLSQYVKDGINHKKQKKEIKSMWLHGVGCCLSLWMKRFKEAVSAWGNKPVLITWLFCLRIISLSLTVSSIQNDYRFRTRLETFKTLFGGVEWGLTKLVMRYLNYCYLCIFSLEGDENS